jgi:hypothetical protein
LRKGAEIPEEATAGATYPVDLTFARLAFSTNATISFQEEHSTSPEPMALRLLLTL